MSKTLPVFEQPTARSLFSPAGRSAERSEAMRGSVLEFVAWPPSSGATCHLLPDGEKRSRSASAYDRNLAKTSTQEALHAPRS
ncbi:hypothetical protein ASE23_17260 [Rhizobium sp. Root73]|nr:hypothetical protein ASC96_23045 [Rhizobium sp. Root1204]KQY01881.1 hypothetical protein ASD36_17265 [Rhizobium sp. Root1334]KRB97459.1 hypothetical protein ASE23_17260 [Rhizobium sp. Root73]